MRKSKSSTLNEKESIFDLHVFKCENLKDNGSLEICLWVKQKTTTNKHQQNNGPLKTNNLDHIPQ